MAALIGKVDSARGNTVHRLGHREMHVQAATWRTFVDTYLNADGSGYVEVTRGGKVVERLAWDAESTAVKP